MKFKAREIEVIRPSMDVATPKPPTRGPAEGSLGAIGVAILGATELEALGVVKFLGISALTLIVAVCVIFLTRLSNSPNLAIVLLIVLLIRFKGLEKLSLSARVCINVVIFYRLLLPLLFLSISLCSFSSASTRISIKAKIKAFSRLDKLSKKDGVQLN